MPSYAAFRIDPDNAPLPPPSGRIEIAPKTIASFKNRNLLAHHAWYPPTEWLGSIRKQYPFHLISGQPAEKLHSQLDHGPVSRAAKINGRATIGLNPSDADKKGIGEGDAVRAYNDRGACLATAKLDPAIMAGVVAISTGPWLDAVTQPDCTLLCRGGNPNALTRDHGATELAQWPTAHSCLIDVKNVHRSARSTQCVSTAENRTQSCDTQLVSFQIWHCQRLSGSFQAAFARLAWRHGYP